MAITLRPEHEQLIVNAMRTGAYQSSDDVISRALEMLHSEDEWLRDQKDSFEAKIERAFAQFENGEFLSAENSRADMEKRKEEWLARQRLAS
jgi:Arc/MetJ-type ribon-helix-helix transcriptional regulator